MFKFDLEIPTYAEWKVQLDKLMKEQPEQAKRGFCRKCGASLFFKVIGSNIVHIAAGMFNGPTKLKTKMNIFVKRKLDYYKLDNRLATFKRYPK